MCLTANAVWADSEYLYVYRNDRDFNYFSTDRLDSIVYSDIDMAGNKCAEAVVQEFWVNGKATRIPLVAIDSIRFVSPEENLVLIDPVRYKRPQKGDTINPNLLLEYIESMQLLSVDTATMMAHVSFTGQVPQLYKGAMLYIPDGESAYFMRVLESTQDGNEAWIHFVTPSIGEIIFNTSIMIGDDAPSQASAQTRASNRRKIIEAAKDVNFGIGYNSLTFASTVTATLHQFDLNTRFSMKLDIPDAEGEDDHISEGTIRLFNVDFTGKAKADCALSFHPNVGVSLNLKEIDWKAPRIPFTIPIVIPTPIPPITITVPLTGIVEIKGDLSLGLKTGTITVEQPFILEGGVNFGVNYTSKDGVDPYGHVSFDVKDQEPVIDHSPDVELGVDFTPFYPQVTLSIARIPILEATVSLKNALKANIRGLVLDDGQKAFQAKIGLASSIDGNVEAGIGKYTVSTGGEMLKIGEIEIWKEPSQLDDLDSLKNVYIHQKGKTKRKVSLKAQKVDHLETGKPAPEPEIVPLNNKVNVEIRTKGGVVNPKEDEGLLIMSGSNTDSKKLDDEGLYEWANEYQEVDPDLSTFQPIMEGYVPAGIETKQLLRIIDPETLEVIDSAEIVPIGSIRNFDVKATDVEKGTGRVDTWKSDIKVRDFGEDVEETGVYRAVIDCPWHGHHIANGTYSSSFKNRQASRSWYLEDWSVGDGDIIPCEKISDSGNSPHLMLSGLFARSLGSPAAPFMPKTPETITQPYVYANLAENMDQTRWVTETMGYPSEVTFSESTYHGIDCVVADSGDDIIKYWHNIHLETKDKESDNVITTDMITILPDSTAGQPHGPSPIVLNCNEGEDTEFGDGNLPENRVTSADKPNIPVKPKDDGGNQGVVDNSLGTAEWTNTWKPGIYEMGTEDERIMIAVSTDKWTYFIPNVEDREGANLEDFDDVDYDYDDYTFHMPCGFKWCDRGSTTYYYVENPATGEAEAKEFHFDNRAQMCSMTVEHGFADVKMILSYIKPEYMTRVADAGTHQETYNTILKLYKK